MGINKKIIFLAMATALGTSVSAYAAAPVYQSALSSRIVTILYNPGQTYTIYTRPLMVTDIRIPRGSKLVGMAVGDSIRWRVEHLHDTGNIFIKPIKAGLETSATLVTTRHTYQIMLVSRKHGAWYQQVSLKPNPDVIISDPQAESSNAQQGEGKLQKEFNRLQAEFNQHKSARAHKQSDNSFTDVDLNSMSFHWIVQGKASFAPTRVFSSKNFVWMKIPKNIAFPVVFARSSAHAPWGIVNYNEKGRWIIVQGVPSQIELRANGEAVFVSQKGLKPESVDNNISSGQQDNFLGGKGRP